MAACLHFGAGTAVSFRSAGVLRGLSEPNRMRLEVTTSRSRNRRRPPGIVIHSEPGGVPPEDVSTIDAIPVTKPARTLLDLATVEPDEVVERCLEDALRRRLVSLPFLERWLQDPRRKRRRGARLLRRLVDERATVGVTESPLETTVLRLLKKAGLPLPMLQFVVRDGERFIARLDFAYPEERIAIEADGFRYHEGRRSFDRDRARANELQVLGWHVLHVTSMHVENPDGVVSWVRSALSRYA